MNPIEYASLPRDSKRESETLKWLRTLDEYSKFEFIWRVLRASPSLGLPLVKRGQLKHVHLEVILEYGLVYGDASSVRWWYESTVEGLGEKKAIQLISSHVDDAPLIVEKMLYWLRPQDNQLKQMVENLRAEFASKHPDFKSTRSTGIHGTSA